jgi:hypothetical protein
MAKYLHPDVLDIGLQYIIDQAAGNVDLLLLDSYSVGQAYATVDSNKVMTINLAGGDLSLANFGTYGRQMNVAEKAGSASASATSPDLHVAIVDVTNTKVLAVTDETSDQDVTNGNPITIPTFAVKLSQPV